MKKVYAVTTDETQITALHQAWQTNFRTSLRHEWYSDTTLNQWFVIFYPRNLSELLTIQSMPGITVLPDLEDQVTKLPAYVVSMMPPGAMVTTEHNTYQTALKLFSHYQWRPFHPLH
jgi:hypothetical protein